ncbi:MAG: glucans biosynthesis glucosyltransferase MdoH [Pseudomonadota bacterium]
MKAARLRRFSLLCIILMTCVFSSAHMAEVLPNKGNDGLELAIVIVFAVLFSWISIGFWEAMAGVWILARRYDRFALTGKGTDEQTGVDPEARTAILFPISNEEVGRVFSGLRNTYISLEKTGQLSLFDFYILSDSSDPDKWIQEEVAWMDHCCLLKAYGRLHYRRRRVNIKRKSGNIADFCRRWGRNYRYMVVLDADSVMAGTTLIRMVQLMERHPRTGMLQTAPLAVNRETMISRIQQFANHVYGPLFAAGLHYIQLGDAHFWGHNAIIRIVPFMKHCGLPQLPGKPPRGGLILSHDFVEAALIRRGGWEVWLAYDLGGSYEEVPAALLEELKRDRRWCQGNLQHMRLLFKKGLLSAHRALFLHGAMSYGSALLWVLFLGLSSMQAALEAFRIPVYFPSERVLFPTWPVWYPHWALALLSMTAGLLFLPKLFGVLLIMIQRGRARLFGGHWKLLAGMLAEVFFSALFAPIRMLFHSKFVLFTLLGRQVGWAPQRRSDLGTRWGEAIKFHGGGTMIALIWGLILFTLNRPFFWWICPIIFPLILSIPLSVLSSRPDIGKSLKKSGLFLIPEEIEPPAELLSLHGKAEGHESLRKILPIPEEEGFIRAIVDPNVNALHRALLRKKRKISPGIVRRRQELRDKALTQGPGCLTMAEKKELLCDPERILELHNAVWEEPDPRKAEMWGIPC